MAQTPPIAQKDRAEPTIPERTRGGVYFTPRVDIIETDRELLLVADVPGARPDDVELNYERGELVLHARVRPAEKKGQALLAEYEEGDFYRAFTIHESVDNARIEAACKNGVVTVRLPKIAAAQPRQIKVQPG